MDCLYCAHYKLMYERDPKRVYDGCEIYDSYLKNDSKNHRLIPCKNCADDRYSRFVDIRQVPR